MMDDTTEQNTAHNARKCTCKLCPHGQHYCQHMQQILNDESADRTPTPTKKRKKSVQWSTRENSIIPESPLPPRKPTPGTEQAPKREGQDKIDEEIESKLQQLNNTRSQRIDKVVKYMNDPSQYFVGEKLKEVKRALIAFAIAKDAGSEDVKKDLMTKIFFVCGIPAKPTSIDVKSPPLAPAKYKIQPSPWRVQARMEYIKKIRSERWNRIVTYCKHPDRFFRGEKLAELMQIKVTYKRAGRQHPKAREMFDCYIITCGLLRLEDPIELPDYLEDEGQ